MKRILTRRALLLFGVAILALAAGCKKSKDNNPQPQVAGLMAFNLSPDQPLAGISLSGNHLVPLPYTSYTGGYIRIYPGSRSTASYEVSNGNTLATTTYNYAPGKYYSLFVMGADSNYSNVVVNDGLDTLSGTAGQSYIRYVNAITDSSDSKVTVGGAIDTQSRFGDVSDFMKIAQGSAVVTISNSGSINATRTIELKEGKIYTILFLGNPSGTSATDSVQIRYVENGTLELDSTAAKADSVH